jgi:betaine-aldehyde dehydrogenase
MTIAGLWIDGAWVQSGAVGVSINPSTGKTLGQFYDGGRAEADKAIAAARRAFDDTEWAHDRQLRARALMELADQLEAKTEVLISMNARETGKTIRGASLEAHTAPGTLRHNAGVRWGRRWRRDARSSSRCRPRPPSPTP